MRSSEEAIEEAKKMTVHRNPGEFPFQGPGTFNVDDKSRFVFFNGECRGSEKPVASNPNGLFARGLQFKDDLRDHKARSRFLCSPLRIPLMASAWIEWEVVSPPAGWGCAARAASVRKTNLVIGLRE